VPVIVNICFKAILMNRAFLVFFLVFYGLMAIGSAVNVDSLKAKLPQLRGQELILACNTLAWELKYADNEQAWKYCRQAASLLKKNPFKEGLMLHNRNLGVLYIMKAGYDSSLYYISAALKLAQEIKNPFQKGKILNIQSVAFCECTMFKNAIKAQKEALAIFEEIHDTAEILGSLNNLAVIYGRMNFDSSELAIHLKVFDMEKRRGNDYGISRSANNIGMALNSLGNTIESRKFFQIGIGKAISSNNPQYLVSAYYGMGEAERIEKNYIIAISWFKLAVEIAKRNSFNDFLSLNLASIGRMYKLLNENDSAFIYLTKSINVVQVKGGNLSSIISPDIDRGWLFLQADQPDSAAAIVKKYLPYSDSIDFGSDYAKLLDLMANVAYQRGNYKEAFDFLRSSHIVSDSIAAKRLKAETEEIQARYELSGMEETNRHLHEDIEAQSRINRIQNAVVVVISLLVIASLVLLFLLRRKSLVLHAANKMLAEQKHQLETKAIELDNLNHTKDMFFSIVAHDLKNPLQGIQGCVSILNEDFDSLKEDEIKELHNLLNDSTSQFAWLLDNLLQWARSQMKMHVVFSTVFALKSVVEEEVSAMMLHASIKKISLEIGVPETFIITADQEMIRFVIRNLASNAIKFTKPEGTVRIDAIIENQEGVIRIIDNGIGMNDEQLDSLFSIKTSGTSVGTSNEKGTGLGLVLCKDFIEQNHGRIEVNSVVGTGTIISVYLPI